MLNIPFNMYGINYNYLSIYVVANVVVAIIIFIGKMFFKDFFEGRQQRTKRNEFQRFLRYHKSVNQYIRQYEMFNFFVRPKAILCSWVGLILGLISPFMFFLIVYFVTRITAEELPDIVILYTYIFSSTFTLSLVFIILTYLDKFIKSEVDGDIFLEKYMEYANKFTMILFYIISSYPVVLFLFSVFLFYYYIYLDFSQKSILNYATICLVIINLVLLSLIPLLYSMLKQEFEIRLKMFLNSKGSKFFPFLYVLTIEQSQMCGIITDIFDDKLLILEDNRIKKVTMWNSVCTLEVCEGEIRDLSSQKKLRDFI